MDIIMPKQFELSLENLFHEQTLTGWTIHGSQNQTTVVLRFKMEDLAFDHDRPPVKYKRASPSQTATT